MVLDRTLPRLIEGTVTLRPQNLADGAYFGGRRPEDGRIDWSEPAQSVHNLIRGVAPPYPGALSELSGQPLRVLRSQYLPQRAARHAAPCIYCEEDRIYAQCGDRGVLRLLELELADAPLTPQALVARFGAQPILFNQITT